MKKSIAVLLMVLTAGIINAQVSSTDLSRIIVNTYLPSELSIPDVAKSNLETVLSRITSSNGIGGGQVNGRFIITANINLGTKDIIAGPPQMIAQNMELTLFVGDAMSNTVFSNTTIALKGVGTNENKAFIEAFKGINPKDKRIVEFLEQGKTKIINYYNSKCDFILKQATALSDQNKFEEAISELMLVPEVCESCYTKSRELAGIVFRAKVEFDCAKNLKEANLAWSAQNDETGALKVAEILSETIPSDGCNTEIEKLSDEIKQKLEADKREQYERELLERKQQMEAEKKRLETIEAIALEYLRNQPERVVYNRIYWY